MVGAGLRALTYSISLKPHPVPLRESVITTTPPPIPLVVRLRLRRGGERLVQPCPLHPGRCIADTRSMTVGQIKT